MAVEGIPYHANGKAVAAVICDECGHRDEVPCAYKGKTEAKSRAARPNEGQARSKAIQLGWSIIRNKMRCPACEEKRKSEMKQETVTKLHQTTPARSPSKRQRIEIFTMLAEVYDIDAGLYKNGDTDDSVADVLGVMPGWVAEIREEEFGPAGGNESIENLIKQIAGFEKDCAGTEATAVDLIKRVQALEATSKAKLAEVSAMKSDLERIKGALSPRVQKASGVK